MLHGFSRSRKRHLHATKRLLSIIGDEFGTFTPRMWTRGTCTTFRIDQVRANDEFPLIKRDHWKAAGVLLLLEELYLTYRNDNATEYELEVQERRVRMALIAIQNDKERIFGTDDAIQHH